MLQVSSLTILVHTEENRTINHRSESHSYLRLIFFFSFVSFNSLIANRSGNPHLKLFAEKEEMATMAAALQSSFTALNISSNSLLGQRFSPSFCPPLVKSIEQPSSITAKLKRWERKECKPNSLPVLHKMHVKVGDTVKVISGKDKGKISEITSVITHNSHIMVKDVNLKTKHVKSKEEGEQGQIIKIEAPIHSSNVMLYSKEQNMASRVGHKTLENGKRVRYLIKTGEIIDSAENWKRAIKEKEKATEAVAAS